MTTIILKQASLKNTLIGLKIALDEYEKTETAYFKEFIYDAIGYRFKTSCELFWRFIKEYLDYAHGTIPAESGARSIIRAACKIGVVSEEETDLIMEMIEYRNRTSHMYLESVAIQIAEKVPLYAKLMTTIAHRITLAE